MIGIVGAMDSEVDGIFAAMTSKEKVSVNNLVFYKGRLFEKDAVIVKCGVGKVNAALCAQLMILKFGVKKIINTGIAGAVGRGLKIYDFVVSTSAVYHDCDVQFFGYKAGQVPGMPETFSADEAMVRAALGAFERTSLAENHRIVSGLIASGDQFIAGKEKKDFIDATFHPQCVEMEGCAIAHTCFVSNVPFVIIRCMSDTADDSVRETYSEDTAAKLSCDFLMEVVKSL